MADTKITRDVIMDLLPIYESGEASADTQGIVTAFLASDPEFARLIARMKQTGLRKEIAAPPPELELKSLERTKRLMKQQKSVMAVAVFFSLLPFVFTFQGGRVTWLLIRDAPVVGASYLFTGVVLWIWYLAVRRMLKIL